MPRFTRFIILEGAIVKVEASETKYRRSLLNKGGREIPVEVHIENCTENQQELTKYKTVVAESYHNGK